MEAIYMFKQKKRTWIHLFFITAVLAVFTAAASAQAVKKELRNTQDYPNYPVKKAVDPTSAKEISIVFSARQIRSPDSRE